MTDKITFSLTFRHVGKNRIDDALNALCWLRGWVAPSKVQEEFESVKAGINQLHSTGNQTTGEGRMESFKAKVSNFRRRTFIKPFVLVLACFFMSNNSGIPTLQTYSVGIFATLGSPIDKYYATIMLGVAQMLGCIFCAAFIHYTGKRPLVIISTLIQSLLFGAVGFYAYFYVGVTQLDNGEYVKNVFQNDSNALSWVPLVGLIGGSLSAYSGARLLPWIIIAEIFPPEIRAPASGIGATFFYLFAFAANKGFFSLVDTITLPGVYWLYSIIALSAMLLYYFFLPETEGWSLLEVQEHFEGKRNLIKAGKKKKGNVSGIDNLAMSIHDAA